MITKKQWAKFCVDVGRAKSICFASFINGRRILRVDTFKHEIWAGLAGTPVERFNYNNIVKGGGDSLTLLDMYKRVELNLKLDKLPHDYLRKT
jgi:hypothetical protein